MDHRWLSFISVHSPEYQGNRRNALEQVISLRNPATNVKSPARQINYSISTVIFMMLSPSNDAIQNHRWIVKSKENVCNAVISIHDDVNKWKHFPPYWPFVRGIHRSLVNSPHKGQWRGALMFPLICAWTNGLANHQEAGNLRRNRADYDVTVMI